MADEPGMRMLLLQVPSAEQIQALHYSASEQQYIADQYSDGPAS